MYAVIQTGGKQYRVEPGKTVVVETLAGDKGASVVFDHVLLVSSGDGGSVTVGKPTVAGAKVEAKIKSHYRGPKIIVFKFRRRKNYRRKQGHRQPFTELKITGVSL